MESGFNAFKGNNYIYVMDGAESAYKKLINYKTKKLMVPLFGESKSIGTIPPIPNWVYGKKIYEYYTDLVGLGVDKDKKDMSIKFLSQFSDNEILSNKTTHNVVIGNRTYRPGTKVFRLLRKFAEVNNVRYDFENKLFNQLKLQDQMVKPIYLTVLPELFLQATRATDSCFRIGGEHEDSALGYPTLPYSMIAYTEDLTWRAFIFFSPEEKRFTQMPGYPRENFYAQVAVRKFFEDKGCTITSHYHFNHGFYQDNDVFFTSVTALKNVPRYKPEDFLTHDIYKGYKIQNSDYRNVIAAYCEDCDKVHIGKYSFEGSRCDGCKWWDLKIEAGI